MELSEWNDRIFREAVARVGRPGDPLYFYVDEDVLSAATDGAQTPEVALTDFATAVNQRSSALQFQKAAEQAQRWVEAHYEGSCPFVWALAITVLGVSLPHLGRSSNNVYGRTRHLLGLDPDGGIPDGYAQWVPVLWSRWNEYLATSGRDYGTPTASPTRHAYQGWARSQSFIRSVDKEIILDFFSDTDLPETTSPTTLLRALQIWLAESSKQNDRLLQRVLDPSLAEEFTAFLASAWGSFHGEQSMVRRISDLPARLLWNQDEGLLDLVVDTRITRWLVGTKAHTFAGESHTLTHDDSVFYLTDAETPPEDWIDDRLDRWALAPGAVVSRTPQEIYPFRSDENGWLESPSTELAFPLLLLVREEILMSIREFGSVETSAAPVRGWHWIRIDDESTISSSRLQALMGTAESETSMQLTRLIGGLRLSRGNTYLSLGEPDLLIDRTVVSPRVFLNERDISTHLESIDLNSYHLGQESSDERDGTVLRLSALGDGPGLKRLEIFDDDVRVAGHRFAVNAPIQDHGWLDPNGIVSVSNSSLAVRKAGADLAAFVADSGGQSWMATSATARWVADIGIGAFVASPTLLVIDDCARPAAKGSTYVMAHTGAGRNARWAVRLIPPSTTSGRQEPPAPLPSHLRELVSNFVSAPAASIDTDLPSSEVRKLQNQLLNSRHGEGQSNGTRWNTTQTHATPRTDVLTGASGTHNAYNAILSWLSELPATHVSFSRFDEAWRWALSRTTYDADVSASSARDLLESLGHIEVDRRVQRVSVKATTLVALPRSGATNVLAGARPQALIDALISGDTEWDAPAEVDHTLQQLVVETLHAPDGSAPDYHYVRFVSSAKISDGFRRLGINCVSPGSEEVVRRFGRLEQRAQAAPIIDRVQGMRYEVWQQRPHATEARGRWVGASSLPEGDHFVRIGFQRERRWAWYSSSTGQIRDVGWVDGRWLAERAIGNNHLVQHSPRDERLYVSASMPIPATLRMALTLTTGIAPQTVTLTGASKKWQKALLSLYEMIGQKPPATHPQHRYVVYEGIDSELAKIVRDALGQH